MFMGILSPIIYPSYQCKNEEPAKLRSILLYAASFLKYGHGHVLYQSETFRKRRVDDFSKNKRTNKQTITVLYQSARL